MFQITRVTPVKPEHLREHLSFFGRLTKNSVQRPIEIGLAVEPRHGNCLNGGFEPAPARSAGPIGAARARNG